MKEDLHYSLLVLFVAAARPERTASWATLISFFVSHSGFPSFSPTIFVLSMVCF